MRIDNHSAMCKCGAGLFRPPLIGSIEGDALEWWAKYHSGEGHGPAVSYQAWQIARYYPNAYATSSMDSDFRGVQWEATK